MIMMIYDDGNDDDDDVDVLIYVPNDHVYDGNDINANDHDSCDSTFGYWFIVVAPNIRGNLGSKMGLIRKRANNKFCELEFKNE